MNTYTDATDIRLQQDLENAYASAERMLEAGNQRYYEACMKTIYRIELEIESRKTKA